MTDSALQVIATIPIQPEHADTAGAALSQLAEASRAEEGCLQYDVFTSAAAPGLFITIEKWRSQADMDAHMTTPHVATAFEVAGPLLAGEVAIHPLHPA